MPMKILFWLGSLQTADCSRRVDPNCPDFNLNEICSEECSLLTVECIQNCDISDSLCISSCLREESICIEKCPCGNECPGGCDDQCENSICQCSDFEINQDWSSCIDQNSLSLGRCVYNCQDDQNCEANCVSYFKTNQKDCPCEDNCKSGCPCNGYECDVITSTTDAITTTEMPTEKVVLVLNTNSVNNVPMTIDFEGNTNYDINFEFGEGTNVGYGCSATLNGNFWVFGGLENEQQISRIEGCKLQRIGDLSFNFRDGTCNTFLFPQQQFQQTLLCFDYRSQKECHLFDGQNMATFFSTEYSHGYTYGLASYNGQPFITGSYNEHSKTEIMNFNTFRWTTAPDYPFRSYVGYYSSVSSSDAVFIIGGFNGGDPYDSTVAKFTDYNWYKVGELNTGRYSHSSVSHNGITVTLGGFSRAYDDVNTEFWDFGLSEGQEFGPELPRGDYSYGTTLFLVELDFCTYPQ